MFKLTLPDTVIAWGALGGCGCVCVCMGLVVLGCVLTTASSVWPREMKTQWNELKCLHETAKINSMTEMAQTLHREGLCDLSAIRTTSADVEKKWIPSCPLSCTWLTGQERKLSLFVLHWYPFHLLWLTLSLNLTDIGRGHPQTLGVCAQVLSVGMFFFFYYYLIKTTTNNQTRRGKCYMLSFPTNCCFELPLYSYPQGICEILYF